MMNDEDWIRTLYSCFLNREPQADELVRWTVALSEGFDSRECLLKFIYSKEYVSKRRVRLAFPAGHYYSPVVDPDVAAKYANWDKNIPPEAIKGLRYPAEQMWTFLSELEELLAGTPFSM